MSIRKAEEPTEPLKLHEEQGGRASSGRVYLIQALKSISLSFWSTVGFEPRPTGVFENQLTDTPKGRS